MRIIPIALTTAVKPKAEVRKFWGLPLSFSPSSNRTLLIELIKFILSIALNFQFLIQIFICTDKLYL